jgi:hypothetical protein
MADSLDECVSKLKAWKDGMKTKGLRVNMKETKLMVSGPELDPVPSLVPSVGVEFEVIPSNAHNVDCGYIRSVAMSMENLLSIQTTSAQDAVARQDLLMADQSRK